MAKRHTLEKKIPTKRAPFEMKAPNDNLDAYGWSLHRLRLPTNDPDTAGRPAFNLKISIEEIKKYGVDLEFVDPKYLQYMLDQQPEIQRAVQKTKAAGYSPEALEKLSKVIVRLFEERVLVDIVQRFFRAAPLVAQFYAAKRAHEDTFGPEEVENEDRPQIEAKTTKSRR